MKKYLLLVSILSGFYTSIYAQTQFITTSTTQVGPGVTHKKIIEPTVPWNINVLEIDLTNPNPYMSIESVKANDRLSGYERTSFMAARNDYEMHRVVGAINGDFYGPGGIPIGAQVLDGILLKRPTTRSIFGCTDLKKPFTDIVSFYGTIATSDSVIAIDGVNEVREADKLIIYNKYYGSTTGTNYWGTEITAEYLTEQPAVNDTILVLVVAKDSIMAEGHGNNTIPSNGIVISGHGTASSFPNEKVFVGDTLFLILQLPPVSEPITELIGGAPRLIRDGVATVEWSTEGCGQSFATDRHPRTAVGFSQDSTKLYFFTVDGRQPGYSVGMSLYELADYMLKWGIYQGVNLDGGGSTTMIVRDVVANSPSEAERAVANALLAVSSAPQDSLTIVQIEPDNCRMFIGESVKFSASGWDQYYNPIELDQLNIEFRIDTILGSIDANGLYTATTTGVSGYIYSIYDTLVDSAYVYLKSIEQMDISPEVCVTDTIQTLSFNVQIIDEDGLKQTISSNYFQWQSLNPSVGIIDSMGNFKGKSEGTTEVVVSFEEKSDTAVVTVEIREGTVVLDSMDTNTIANWSVSGENYDSLATILSVVDTPRTFGTGSFRLDYQFVRVTTGLSYVYLNTDIPVYGVPDTLLFDFKSNGLKHLATVVVSDANNELFSASAVVVDTAFNTYSLPTARLRPISSNPSFDHPIYPIRIKSIQIRLRCYSAVGETNKGMLYIDYLRVTYPSVTSITEDRIPAMFKLCQNYPNPFNSTTKIRFQIHESELVTLKVYNILGQELATLVDEIKPTGNYEVKFDRDNLSSGVYFYRLQAGSFIETKKFTILK